MDIRSFRAELSQAFQSEGFVEERLFKGANKVWMQRSSGEIVSYFVPDAQRRTWGFRLLGVVGIDIPALRQWLNQHKPGSKSGIFQVGFVGYYTANDDVLGDFQVEHGLPVPADLWVGLIKDRLDRIPQSLTGLLETYRKNREELGWLAHPHEKAAWDFLVKWHKNCDPALHVPYRLPNGQVV
ncbi:hypothetical protein OSJ57_04895 [Sphingomonas sp. HH69]